MATSSSSRPTPERIFQTLQAHQQTATLKTAIELDLFTAIDEGNSTSEQIAKRLQLSERGVRILCDYLTIQGFLKKQNGRYSLAEDSTLFLSKRSPQYMGTLAGFMANEQHYQNLARLPEVVRRGGTTSEKGDNRKPNDALWVLFARCMAPLTVPSAMFIARLVNGENGGRSIRVLDIAAGHGMYGITIAQQNPKAAVTALDWPAVLEVAKENAEQAGVVDRFTTLAGSAFETDFGEGYDVLLLTNIFHHFDKPTCVQLMRRALQALKPGGKAVTLEFVPNEDRVSPATEAAFSLQMLIGTDAGDAYTFSEYQTMFRTAGFFETTLHAIPGMPQELIVSEKGL